MKGPVRLAGYSNAWYKPGASTLKSVAWFFVGRACLRAAWLPSSAFRVWLLRLFGAKIGRGAVLKPSIDVKYPWHLMVGDDCWLGEHVWIDNLALVEMGSNVCVSQGAYFCTGNHDWTDPHFGLRVGPITLEDGAWVGAKAIITPGVRLGICSIVTAGSVVSGTVPNFHIVSGNPAVFIKVRTVKSSADTDFSDSFEHDSES